MTGLGPGTAEAVELREPAPQVGLAGQPGQRVLAGELVEVAQRGLAPRREQGRDDVVRRIVAGQPRPRGAQPGERLLDGSAVLGQLLARDVAGADDVRSRGEALPLQPRTGAATPTARRVGSGRSPRDRQPRAASRGEDPTATPSRPPCHASARRDGPDGAHDARSDRHYCSYSRNPRYRLQPDARGRQASIRQST